MSNYNALILDLQTLIAYYAYKKLKDSNCRRITFQEIEDYKNRLITDLKKNGIELILTNYSYSFPIDFVSYYSGMFTLTDFQDEKGFLINARISYTQIYKIFLDNIGSKMLSHLSNAFWIK